MHINPLAVVRVKRVNIYGDMIDIDDEVATEVGVSIYVDNKFSAFLYSSPGMLLELGLGYALSHGFDITEHDINVSDSSILIYSNDKNRKCILPKNIKVKLSTIFNVFNEVIAKAVLFKKTGCFHVVAISTLGGEIIELVEDISRHSALYKAIGSVYRRGIDLCRVIVVMSSRANQKILLNIANLCIPIAIFRGAPTLGAIDIAKKFSITLIAHIREGRANIYSEINRISVNK